MNNIKILLDSMITFLKTKHLLSLVIACGLLILFLLFLSSPLSPKQTVQNPPQNSTYRMPTKTLIPTDPLNLYDPKLSWSPKNFSEANFQKVTFQKTQLSDGLIQYTYPSSTLNRPNEIIVNNGTVIYQRVGMGKKYIYNYTGTLGAPEYVFQGSRYYGPNTMVYVYVKTGTAFVADAKTTLVREQINFQPKNIEDFKKNYGEDIIDFTIIPTLPEE